MIINRKIALASLVLVVGLGGFSDGALAATKLTYDQAWAQCTKEIANVPKKDNDAGRHAAGGACMKKYGYRLKKGAEM